VLSTIAIVPSAPVIVPQLASGAAAELTGLRDAVLQAAASLPARWIAIGLGTTDSVVESRRSGTFAGYGADVRVTLAAGGSADETAELPLCALVAGWVRGQVRPDANVDVRVYAADHDAAAALDHGSRLRGEIDDAADAVGVLVVADGANTLTAAAPGGYDPDTIPLQAALDDALASGDAAALTRLPDAIVGRVAYQVLAGLTGFDQSCSRPDPGPRSATELYRGAPYGVGYFVGVWTPAGRSDGGTAHPEGRGTTGGSTE
jgi:hypothetical protein